MTTDSRTVINAAQVANESGRPDGITALDVGHARFSLDTFNGRYDGKGVQYLHQEASVGLIAAIEGSTYAPNLDAAPGLADDQGTQSARAAILPIVNGPLGAHNPERQGRQSALLGQGDPLKVTTVIPGDSDYSPAWDIHPSVWTPAAIAAGDRVRLDSDSDVVNAVEHGLLVSAGVGPRNES